MPPIPPEVLAYDGVTVPMERNRAGLLPFVQQITHNNYSPGITSLHFSFQTNSCTLTFKGPGEENRLLVGLDGKPRRSVVSVGGEHYPVAATGVWKYQKANLPVLCLTVSFLELPNSRLLDIVFRPTTVSLRFDERPGRNDCLSILAGLTSSRSLDKLVVDLTMKNQQFLNAFARVATPIIRSKARPSAPAKT